MSGWPFVVVAAVRPSMIPDMVPERVARSWLLMAAVAVVVQEAFTTYPDSQSGTRVFWDALSLVLLWFVYRHSNLARIVFGAMAAIGFVLFALAALDDPTSTATALALLYAVQAGSMLAAPVRSWTRTQAAPPVASRAK
jgi:hypothetical protein